MTDKQCHAVANKLVYSTDSQFLSQYIKQLDITVEVIGYSFYLPRKQPETLFLGFLKKIKRAFFNSFKVVALIKCYKGKISYS